MHRRPLAGLRERLRSRRALVAVAALAAAVQLTAAAGNVGDVVRAGHQGFAERSDRVRDADLDPLAAFASTAALALARDVIPADATFAIVIGNDPPVIDPGATRLVLRLWLQPRRYTPRPADADWVIVYNASSESLRLPYTREVGLGPKANAVEVKR